jgi:hypothetical protein
MINGLICEIAFQGVARFLLARNGRISIGDTLEIDIDITYLSFDLGLHWNVTRVVGHPNC